MPSRRYFRLLARPPRSVRWVLLVVALLGGALGGYAYRQHKRYRHFAVHEEGRVYRSAWVDDDVFAELIEKHKIRTVVNLCYPGEMGDRIDGQREAVSQSGARLLEMSFPPNNTWSLDFPVVGEIEQVLADPKSYPIWIHCQHGRERTVKALAIYDIAQRQMTAQESLERMPLYGMPHPWHVVVFAHNYETRQKAPEATTDAGPSKEPDTYVYVSVAGEQRIAVYRQRPDDGTLEKQGDVQLDAEPGALAVDPRRRYLFASLRSAGRLASFRIDPRTAMITQVSNIPADADPAYVATDRAGRYLLSAYYAAGRVMVHRIAADGSLDETPVENIVTDANAHAILTDSSNRWCFVPHTGPNAIFQFRFDADAGRLTPNMPAQLPTGEQTGPRHVWFHPGRPFVYSDNEQGSSVTAYQMDEAGGTLSPIETWSTLPDGYDQPNSCAAMRMTPDGRYLYAANRGHDSIAGFAVDAETCRLTPLRHTPTEPTPRSFDIDPAGRYLYAAGQSSGKLAAFGIDDSTGGLRRLATYDVGTRPWWVQVVQLAE